MRFVNLKKKLRYTTCYERISSLGCGPNFVLNRVSDFKTMIKDQGVKFWFRFWLNFSFHSEIIEEPMVTNTHTIDVMRILCGLIHNKFLEGSPKDTMNYCLNIFTNVMTEGSGAKITSIKNVNEEKKLEQEDQNNSLTAFLEYHFGCALCEVFYVWLEAAPTFDSKINYWTCPELYFRPDFQPRLIEHYFVHAWGVRVLHLLGVDEEAIPWMNILLMEKKKIVKFDLEDNVDNCSTLDEKNFEEMECWDKKLQVMRARLVSVDEFKNEPKKGLNKTIPSKTVLKSRKATPRCAFCFNTDSFITKLKKCSLCVSDKKVPPNYYCGVSCQTEDWFRNHAKEHFTSLPYIQIKPGMIENSTENESKLFTASLFDN
uniref:MYND-type domain-containing protein n=1 Tax=Strigamia maritima TaxID=126957 RepID=T1JFJ4_STRMM